ncbi:unnamed protein product [Thlaspi arvense]|uniref:Uncharacterized protein n=1 Tax=Thlaspi arvense TaxID=13288 RepID=A0AAU9S9K9_THLAR|nr:unnamed protein product [Thlaspi arvense]
MWLPIAFITFLVYEEKEQEMDSIVLRLPIAFIIFLVYEKKEQEIDSIVLSFKSFVSKQKSDVYEKLFGSEKHD